MITRSLRPTPFRVLLVSAFAGVSFPACEHGVDSPVAHPIRDSLSIDPDEALVIRRERATAPAPLRFIDRLNARTSLATIGVMGGAPEYELGAVADALFLADRSLAVLDGMAAVVRVFDLEGAHRHSIGGIGEGPGEFDVPVALISPDDGELWVLDEGRAMHRFAVDAGGHLEFLDRLSLPGFSSDACASGGSILLHTPAHMPGEARGEVLYEIDRIGERRSQFAAPYRYDSRLAAKRLKSGRIACTHDGLVLLAFEAQNRLDAYEIASGRLSWHARFDDVRILPVLEERLADGRPRISVDPRSEPFHHFLLSVTGGVATPAIVQYARRSREDVLDRVDRYEVETYVVDPTTGAGAYAGDAIPEVLTSSGDLIALVHRDPYPRVEIARLGAETRR